MCIPKNTFLNLSTIEYVLYILLCTLNCKMEAQPGPGEGNAGPQWDPTYLPPYFTGKEDQDFNQWYRKLEIAVNNYPVGAPPLANALPSRLDGKAFAFWDQLPAATKQNHQQARNALARVFGHANQLQRIRDFSSSRPRLPNEPLEIYAASLRELVNSAFAGDFDYGDQFREHELLRRFLQGLEPCLQMKCREHGPQTLDQAIAVAQRLEFAQKAAQSQQPNFTQDTVNIVKCPTSSNSNVSGNDMSMLVSQLSLLNQKLDVLKDMQLSDSKPKYREDRGKYQFKDESYDRSRPRTRDDRYYDRTRSPSPGYRDRRKSLDREYSGNRYRSPENRNRMYDTVGRDRGRSYDRQDRDRYFNDRVGRESRDASYDRQFSYERRYDRPQFRDPKQHTERFPREHSPVPRPQRGCSPNFHVGNSNSQSSPKRVHWNNSGNDQWSPKRIVRRPNWNR